MTETKNTITSIRKLRSDSKALTPSFHCSNCKCNRYSKCYCERKKK